MYIFFWKETFDVPIIHIEDSISDLFKSGGSQVGKFTKNNLLSKPIILNSSKYVYFLD